MTVPTPFAPTAALDPVFASDSPAAPLVPTAAPDSAAASDSVAATAEAALEWSVDPWREAPLRAIAGFVAVVALGMLAVRWSPTPLAGWALAVALLALLAPAYLPVRCRLDDAGVGRRLGLGWERRAWTDIRRARITGQGLYVSSLRHGGPLEPFRGLLLPLPRAAAPALHHALARAIEAHGI
ncbi:MAG: hypothetical protein ABIS67_08185 [Candidatus Eisenbacteria bacterium]